MGNVRKRNNGYFIDYRAYGQRYREFIGTSKKLAQDVLNKKMVEIAEGKFLDKKKQCNISFADFSRDYIEVYSKHNKKSWKSDSMRLKSINAFLGHKLLSDITPLLVEEYKAKRIKEVSPATVNRELALLKHMFTMAIQWAKVDSNPVKKVKLFKENNQRVKYLEVEEAERLVKNCNSYLKRIVVIALNTGMRKGEILGLKWKDIDFNRSIIYLINTKNSERREVPINELVKQALIRQPKHKDSAYVFCNNDGQPYGDIKKSFFTALEKSGIKDFRFHDLRHSFASQLVMNGVDLNTVRELLGHKSIRMTLRYSHLSPSHRQRAVGVLAQKWALDGHRRQNQPESQESETLETLDKSSLSKHMPR